MNNSSDSTPGITVDGANFPLADSVEAMCMAIETGGRGVLHFPTVTYHKVFGLLSQWIEKQYGPESQKYREVMSAPLVCAGCLWRFPDYFRMSLLAPGAYKKVAGALPGFDQFGQTGICPQCGGDEALLVYECIDSEEISEADIHAIRRYWQERALIWWSNQQKSQAICDFCNTGIARNQGYLFSDRLICDACVNQTLANALKELQRNPNHYGAGLLRKARKFRR